MINFTDILKGKFLEEFSAISINQMLVAITLSLVLSLFIVLIYRLTYTGVSFSLSFAGCLVMISMVTATVILVITSNIVLSLGMVGALSIVRFRTAVKEASDTAFLFWAIATGIICGAGYVTISILATLLIGLLFVAVCYLGKGYRSGSFMVVARYEADSRNLFFDQPCGYIADAIDLVSCKLDLIVSAVARGIPIISALGTGNKLDASLFRVTDIAKTEGCPLARVVRKELRARGILHHKVVFSPEPAHAAAPAGEAPPPGRRSVPASAPWVPAVAGLLMAGEIILDLAGNNHNE